MKLSDAIRLGSMLAPQAFNVSRDGNGGTCAAEAARDAGYKGHTVDVGRSLGVSETPCPVCSTHVKWCMLAHLNDVHRWTREQIADYVAIQEAAAEQAQPKQAQPVAVLA